MLSNRRIQITDLEFLNSSPVDIQQIPISRGSGSSVVRTRNEARNIKVSGGVTLTNYTADNDSVLYMSSDVNKIFNQQNRYLRTVPKDKVTVLDDCQATTGWTASDDATSIVLDTTNFEWGSTTDSINASVGFSVVVATSGDNYATLTKTLVTPIDLSAFTDRGNFELSLTLEDVYYITSIDFRVGNDSSNYYSTSFTTNYEGKALENGVNYFSVPWGNDVQGKVITETGTVADNLIDYLYVRINYSSSASDFTGNLNFFGHVQENFVRNYPCYSQGGVNWNPSWMQNVGNTSNNFEVNLLNNTGYGIATHDIELFNVAGITSASSTQTVDLKGNLEPQIANTFTLNTITNLTDLRYSNLNKNELIRWTNTWVAGDIVKFDKLNTIVTRNAEPQDFSGKLPGAVNGKNRLQMSVVTGSPTVLSQTTVTGYQTMSGNNMPPSPFVNLAYQTFTATINGSITNIRLLMSYFFQAIYITTNAAGDEPGTILETITSPSVGSREYVDIPLSFNITSGTVYGLYIVASALSGGELAFNSAGGYGSGVGKTKVSTAGSWTTIGDYYFQITQSPTPSTNIDWTATYKPLYL